MLYNDAYRPIMGITKHPRYLGTYVLLRVAIGQLTIHLQAIRTQLVGRPSWTSSRGFWTEWPVPEEPTGSKTITTRWTETDTLKNVHSQIASTPAFLQRRWTDMGVAIAGYFTYSYTPLLMNDGAIGGIFTAVTETTLRVIGERQMRYIANGGV